MGGRSSTVAEDRLAKCAAGRPADPAHTGRMVADDTPAPARADATAAEPLAPMPLVGGVGPIVVGVDGSPCSVLALRWALEQGTRRHPAVHVVLAWSMPMVVGVALAVTSSEYDVRAHARAELDRILHEQADLMGSRPGASPVTSTLRQANPAAPCSPQPTVRPSWWSAAAAAGVLPGPCSAR